MNNRINPLENCNPKRESKKDEFEILQLKEENYSLKQLLSSEDYQIQELQKKVSLLEAELSAKDCPIFETKEDIEELKLDRKILLDEVKAAHHDFVLLDNYLTRCLRAFRPLLEDTDTLDYIYDLFENAQKCACDAREKYATSKEKLNHEKRKEERTIKEEEEKIKTYLGEEKSLELVNEIEDALGEEDKDNAKIARSINQLKANLIESARGNQKLFEEKKRLEENSKLNNSNSHLSSGSLPRFQKVPNTREPSKLKPGGQKGAPGSAPVISEGTRVDEIVELFPKEAEGKSNLECFAGESRYLVEEVVTTKLTKFEQMNAWVEKDGKKVLVKGEFPPEIKARLQYGDSFVSDVVLLNTLGLMSMSRVSLYLSDKFGVTLSASSVAQMLKRVAKCLSPVEEELRKRLIDSKVVHFDETPVNLNGKDVFVHIACNQKYSLLKAGRNRGVKGAKDLGVAEYFKGTSVSDRFSLYRGKLFNHIVKAFCGAHATRDLKQVILKAPEQKWAQRMLDLLKEMNKTAKEAREDGKEKVDTEII